MKIKTAPGSGFSLVEVTLALGVAAISLLAIFGLLPVGLQTNRNAIEQTTAVNLLSAVIADLRATSPTTPRGEAAISSQFRINIPPNPVTAPTTVTLYFTGEGQSSTSLIPESRYRLTVIFLPNGPGSRSATFAGLKMTWPAAHLTVPEGSAQLFTALDRN